MLAAISSLKRLGANCYDFYARHREVLEKHRLESGQMFHELGLYLKRRLRSLQVIPHQTLLDELNELLLKLEALAAQDSAALAPLVSLFNLRVSLFRSSAGRKNADVSCWKGAPRLSDTASGSRAPIYTYSYTGYPHFLWITCARLRRRWTSRPTPARRWLQRRQASDLTGRSPVFCTSSTSSSSTIIVAAMI